MKKLRGFTLIELLIVVAIIAILAAIAVPNFLEAQVRAKVSRVRTDMRSISVAIESYNVDYNQYPMSTANYVTQNGTVNSSLPIQSGQSSAHVNRWTFASMNARSAAAHRFMTLTTPVAFMASLPADPFADTKGTNFGYGNALDQAFILWSYGPDTDQNIDKIGSQIDHLIDEAAQVNFGWENKTFGVGIKNPSESLYTGIANSTYGARDGNPRAFTYDSSNGSVSDGDVWRTSGNQ